ncbi:MAG: TIR domain-containing protein [Butyrivibrio sp.]|nr:TIR domain-containing protein [Butyrivibrio sp.]
MSTHYNAFISYKHADLDNKVAAYVEKHLEHFHIPAKIRKKTGVKKIERIFRDTDELPITSDLSGTIEDALNNADFLIVICSTNTCKSMWVEREINFFLQTHPKENILTVLAEGEPADVVPEILKNKEVTRTDENGNSVTVIEPVEPLSCDFRLPFRVAKNTELPRLAAALIGCQYNDLMDRQRQYKMKRLTAVFAGVLALALGFGAYMFRSNQKISESYRESLISQSKYLANESGKLLDDEQRIDALHLALAALPSEEMPDRPVTVEAVKAITQATGAYVPLHDENMSSAWTYELPNTVEKIRADADNKILAALDKSGNVKVWDTESHEELYSYSSTDWDSEAQTISLLNGNLIIWGNGCVISIDPRNGKTNWDTGKFGNASILKDGVAITSDGNLLVSLYVGELVSQFEQIIGESSGDYGQFVLISSKDGSIIDSFNLSQDAVSQMSYGMKNVCISDDNTKIAFSYLTNNYMEDIGIYDIKTGETLLNDDEVASIEALCFSKDNDLYIAFAENAPIYGSISNMESRSSAHLVTCCLSSEDYSVKWAKNFTCNDRITESDFIYLKDCNTLTYYAGNVADVYDASSGDIIQHFALPSVIVGFGASPDDSIPFFITSSGCTARAATDDDDDMSGGTNEIYNFFKNFSDNLSKTFVCRGLYAVKENSNRIIFYDVYVYDEEWTSFKDAPKTKAISDTYFDDNCAAIMTEMDNGINIDIYDPESKTYITSAQIIDNSKKSYDYTLLGKLNDNLLIEHDAFDSDMLTLYIVNCKSGEIETKELDAGNISRIAMDYKDGKLVYSQYDGSIVIYDVNKNKIQSIKIPSSVSQNGTCFAKGIFYFNEQGYIYLAGEFVYNDNYADYIINLNTKEPTFTSVVHKDLWEKTEYASINEEGTFVAIVDESAISIHNIAGEELANIPINNVKINGFAFYKEPSSGRELLIVPYSNGNLCRYDANTGELIYKTAYTASYFSIAFSGLSHLDYDATFTFDTEHSCIYLQQSHITSVLDLNSFIELCSIGESLGYHAPTDTFISISQVLDDGQTHLGFFKHYTLDDLIRKAKEILGDHEMPQEQKEAYGI